MDGIEGSIRYPHDTPPAEGEAIELAEGILWLRLPLPMALDHVNVYALDDGDGWTLIDTGISSSRTRSLWERIIAGPLSGKPIRRLIGTHHHPDHIGLSGWFQAEHGAEFFTTRTAWLFARMLTLDVEDKPTPEALAFFRAAGMDADIYTKRASERPFNFADIVWPLPAGFTRLSEGGTFHAGGRDWDIRLGNGHAPDHITLWSKSDELVIGGDQLLPSISPNLGVYPTEPMADPVWDWLESCERLSAFATEVQLVLPGHKLPYTGLPTRFRQLSQNHEGALERLLDHLKTPRRGGECFPALFKREIGEREYGLALVETIAHLNHLLIKGDITRDMGEDGAWLWRAK